MNKYTEMSDTLYDYLLRHTLRESESAEKIRSYTHREIDRAEMQIAPEQGMLLSMLIKLSGARRALEVGVFTGYSGLVMLEAMGEEGTLVGCDRSEEWTSVALRFWKEAGVAERAHLRLGEAMESLDELLQEGEAGNFDFAFIDADKTGYDGYYERCLELLKPGGVAVFDNTIWDGQVIDPAIHDADTEAIRAFNSKVHADQRVDMVLLPVGDGMTVARRRVEKA